MKVILKENVKTLGNVGEIINVSPGYARNFLIPQKMAVLADEANKSILDDQIKALQKKIQEEKQAAEGLKKQVDGMKLEVEKKVGGNGRLFGTVTSAELSSLFKAKNLDVEKRMITIENPIKQLGEFEIKAKLFKDVIASFFVKVVQDKKQIEELKHKEIEKQKAAAAEQKAKAEAEKMEAQEQDEEAVKSASDE
jgi:large subunit ribosomal protein L9